MPSSRELISSSVLTGTTASVTFSSIPATYKDLVIRASVRSTGPNVGGRNVTLAINAISTNYSATQVRGIDSTPSSNNRTGDSSWLLGLSNGGDSTANTFSSNEWYLPNYNGSTNKVCSNVSVIPNNGTSQVVTAIANLLSNTAAITSLTLTDSSTGFAAGSSFYLYGIKNS